jgi:hypothetical protein
MGINKQQADNNPPKHVVMCGGMTKEDFEAQYLCKFEVSKEDMMINDYVEAYLIASSGASFAESHRLARDLHEWRISMGIPLKKLNTAKMIVGGRI